MAEPSEPNELSAQERYDAELAMELEKLRSFRKATEEEFAGLDSQDPKTAKAARNKLMELVPDAAEQLAFLIKHSDSDSVRANIAKFVFSEAMKAADSGKTREVWEEMFDKLRPDEVTS